MRNPGSGAPGRGPRDSGSRERRVAIAQTPRPGGHGGRRVPGGDEDEVVAQTMGLGEVHFRFFPRRSGDGGGKVATVRTLSPRKPAGRHSFPPSRVWNRPWSVAKNASWPAAGARGNSSWGGDPAPGVPSPGHVGPVASRRKKPPSA